MTWGDAIKRQIKKAINVVIPTVYQATTGKIVEETFRAQSGIEIQKVRNMFVPSDFGFEGSLDEVMDSHRTISIPKEWDNPEIKEKLKAMIENGIDKVNKGDLLVLTGGRDYAPELLGMKKDGKPVVIEINAGPQLDWFIDKFKVPVHEMIVNYAEKEAIKKHQVGNQFALS